MKGQRLVVLNWRDVHHSRAGGAEAYAHEIARRWVAEGNEVTWLTARERGQARRETIDGIRVRRAGGRLSVYPRALLTLRRMRRRVDAVLDCQNGIPFFAPLVSGPRLPVVQLVHHVHQDQFDTAFGRLGAAVGRVLEGRVARRVYAGRTSVAVSLSTRREMRRRLGMRGPIAVVPNGAPAPAPSGARAARPTVAVVSRLVPHKRIDLLLHATADALPRVPGLRVEIVGGGPERDALQRLAIELGVGDTVTFHGRLPDAARDTLLATGWITACPSDGEGWGCAVLEAAAMGIPCLARPVPGISDAVLDGRTGWLAEPDALGDALVRALTEVAAPERADRLAEACRAWAARFDWDRSAELLGAVLLSERSARRGSRARLGRRRARSDMSTIARFTHPDPAAVAAGLRRTDEVVADGDALAVLLHGCDEVGALTALHRIGVTDADVRLATRAEVLAGPVPRVAVAS